MIEEMLNLKEGVIHLLEVVSAGADARDTHHLLLKDPILAQIVSNKTKPLLLRLKKSNVKSRNLALLANQVARVHLHWNDCIFQLIHYFKNLNNLPQLNFNL